MTILCVEQAMRFKAPICASLSFLLMGVIASAAVLQSPRQGAVALFKAPGMVDAQAEVPASGGRAGRLLLGYTYDSSPLEVVSVDPATGRSTVFHDPGTGENGVKSIAVLPNGTAYFGTYPTGHILKLSPQGDHLVDLGRPSKDPQLWIWSLALGADGKIYGSTSPSTRLIRIDPASDRMEDLGLIDPGNTIGWKVVAAPDGLVYVSLGYAHPQVVAFDPKQGTHQAVLPRDDSGIASTPRLYRDEAGRIIASAGVGTFVLRGYEATPIKGIAPNEARSSLRADIMGRLLAKNPVAQQSSAAPGRGERELTKYEGQERSIFRVTAGTDGQIYGSAAYPSQFFRIDPESGKITMLGLIGPGEVYQMASQGDHVFLAAYSEFGGCQLLDYRISKPFAFAFDADASTWITPVDKLNPSWIHAPGVGANWRPKAMLKGSDGMIYVGAVPGYGQIGGAIFRWDPAAAAAQRFPVSPDMSVVSLCETRGVLVAGLSTEPGTGGKSPAKEAKVVVWRLSDHQAVYETIPIPGADQINDLVALPDGRVYGVAGSSEFFRFDVGSRRVYPLGKLPVACVGNKLNLFSSAGLGPDGNIYGLSREGIFRINTRTDQLDLYARAPAPITNGFAIQGNRIYYASGGQLCWTELPAH